jgi:chorismate-pyruvate lyase
MVAGRLSVHPGRAMTRSLDLDPLDRMLLNTDGTLTTLLEACAGEAIATRTTRESGPAARDVLLAAVGRWWHPDETLLDLGPGERVIARRVVLTGVRSDVPFLLGESLVAVDRLSATVIERLMRAGASLGRVLIAGSMATRRQILEISATRAAENSDDLGVSPGVTLARRTYRITGGHRAVALVTEWLVPGRLREVTFATCTGEEAMQPVQVAADIDTRLIDDLAAPNLEVAATIEGDGWSVEGGAWRGGE